VTSLPDPLPPTSDDAPLAPVAVRGRLVVTERAARNLIKGAAVRTPLEPTDVEVDVAEITDDGVAARVTFVARYPDGALSAALREFRRTVADDVGRLAGRPLRRLDVVVKDLVVGGGPARRVQ
jgi:hypothetical protein